MLSPSDACSQILTRCVLVLHFHRTPQTLFFVLSGLGSMYASGTMFFCLFLIY